MASGVTVAMKGISRMAFWRTIPDREQRPRDRSLRGKARIRARKTARQG